jgi:hypothetical protein
MKHRTDVIRLSSYTPKSYAEKPDQKIVKYGEKNDFPEYLISLFYGSPTHGAICKTKAQMIFGAGFTGDSEAMLKASQLSFNDVAEKCALDLVIQGGFCIELVWNQTKEYISKINHIEFERVRCVESDDEGNINWLYYSEDWTDGKKAQEAVKVKAFDPAMKNEEPRQFLYIRPFTAGLNHYPKPDYLGAVNYIELEQSISEFLVNHMRNGMSPSAWLHFLNGEPDDDEKIKIRREIERQYSGSENAGSVIITYSDGAERKPHIDQVEISDAPKQWEFISDHVTDKILISHRVTTPVLFGVKEAGQLGATQELEMGAQLFEDDVIRPMRRHIVNAFNTILFECGISKPLLLESNSRFTNDDGNVDQSYTGIQITSALEIIERVRSGAITITQGKQLLVAMLGFKQEAADEMFNDVQQQQALSSHECPSFTTEQEAAWLQYLADKGEEIDLNEWELLIEEDASGHEDHKLAEQKYQKLKFFENYADPQQKSEWGDSGLYKLRYQYTGGDPEKKSRDFCRVMMEASNRNIFYRYEDIAAMSDAGVNGQFAPKGQSTYDIFTWKGGVNCHHSWKRLIFFRKTEGGRFLPASSTPEMENDKRVGNVPFVPRKGAEGTRPIDTRTKGRLNLSSIINKLLGR